MIDPSSVRPSARQLAWQQQELTAFVHFGVNTFTDLEWGTGLDDPAVYDPQELSCDQWVRAAGPDLRHCPSAFLARPARRAERDPRESRRVRR